MSDRSKQEFADDIRRVVDFLRSVVLECEAEHYRSKGYTDPETKAVELVWSACESLSRHIAQKVQESGGVVVESRLIDLD